MSGVYLRHRLSRDLDLVCGSLQDVRDLTRALPAVAQEAGVDVAIARDAGSFVRATLSHGVELDVVLEGSSDIEPPIQVEGIHVVSLADLRAAKLTCLLSRSEPRDLVDELFLDRAGFAPEKDLELASRKDAGIDPGILAWLLGQFPVAPLPTMLVPVSVEDLEKYRADLRDRFRRLAIP